MDEKHVVVEITGHVCRREVEHVGRDLVPGETVNKIVLKFPDGKSHLVRVHEDVFNSYLEAIGADKLVDDDQAPVTGGPEFIHLDPH